MNILKDTKYLEKKMEELKQKNIQHGITYQTNQEEKYMHQRWEERAKQQEKLCQQKSKIQWLKCGE